MIFTLTPITCSAGSKSSALEGQRFPSQLDRSRFKSFPPHAGQRHGLLYCQLSAFFPKHSTKGGRLLQRQAFIFNSTPRSVEKVEFDIEFVPVKWGESRYFSPKKKKRFYRKTKSCWFKKYKLYKMKEHFIYLTLRL